MHFFVSRKVRDGPELSYCDCSVVYCYIPI